MANEEQAAFWDGDEGGHWGGHAEDYDRMLAGFASAVLEAAAPGPGDSVLDVGCGCGALTLAAAGAVPEGRATGVDLSGPMLDVARRRADEGGIANATFVKADAQTHSFADPFDVVVSRFGVMFFDDPVAAFTNLLRASATGSRLAFACWQDLVANEWMSVPGAAAAAHVPLPGGAEPGAPGPFAFADGDRVRRILEAAGFTHVQLAEVELPMRMPGQDAADATAFLQQTGMGRILFAEAPDDVVARALDAVRSALAPYETDDGIVLAGRAWLVTASHA